MVVSNGGVWYAVLEVFVEGEDKAVDPVEELEFVTTIEFVFYAHCYRDLKENTLIIMKTILDLNNIFTLIMG